MANYEYRVVPAPRTAAKKKGVKGTEDRYAHTLADLMNKLAGEGWEFQRAEALPCDERRGLGGRQSTTQHMLVFRREAGTYRTPNLGGFQATGEGEAKAGSSKLILEGARKP